MESEGKLERGRNTDMDGPGQSLLESLIQSINARASSPEHQPQASNPKHKPQSGPYPLPEVKQALWQDIPCCLSQHLFRIRILLLHHWIQGYTHQQDAATRASERMTSTTTADITPAHVEAACSACVFSCSECASSIVRESPASTSFSNMSVTQHCANLVLQLDGVA